MSNALLIQERMKETSILSQGSGYKDNYDDVVHMKKIPFLSDRVPKRPNASNHEAKLMFDSDLRRDCQLCFHIQNDS